MVVAIAIFAFIVTLLVGGVLYRLGLPHTLRELVATIAIIGVAGAIAFSLPGPTTSEGPWPYYLATMAGTILAASILTPIARHCDKRTM